MTSKNHSFYPKVPRQKTIRKWYTYTHSEISKKEKKTYWKSQKGKENGAHIQIKKQYT